MKRFLVCLLALCTFAPAAQYSTEVVTTPGYVPNVAADLVTRTVYVAKIYLANKSASAVTVTLKDRSTNCGSAACEMWPAVSIAANSVYVVDAGDVQFTDGINWVASAASSVVACITYRY